MVIADATWLAWLGGHEECCINRRELAGFNAGDERRLHGHVAIVEAVVSFVDPLVHPRNDFGAVANSSSSYRAGPSRRC